MGSGIGTREGRCGSDQADGGRYPGRIRHSKCYTEIKFLLCSSNMASTIRLTAPSLQDIDPSAVGAMAKDAAVVLGQVGSVRAGGAGGVRTE